jgi:hypothetical protein
VVVVRGGVMTRGRLMVMLHRRMFRLLCHGVDPFESEEGDGRCRTYRIRPARLTG